MNLKKGKLFTSKFVGTRPSSYEKIIYRAAVWQRLRNTGLSNRIALWRLNCVSFYNFLLLKVELLQKTANSCRLRDNVFETYRKFWSCVRCDFPLTSLPLHPSIIRERAIWRRQYIMVSSVFLSAGPRPGTGPWPQLCWPARDSPGIDN